MEKPFDVLSQSSNRNLITRVMATSMNVDVTEIDGLVSKSIELTKKSITKRFHHRQQFDISSPFLIYEIAKDRPGAKFRKMTSREIVKYLQRDFSQDDTNFKEDIMCLNELSNALEDESIVRKQSSASMISETQDCFSPPDISLNDNLTFSTNSPEAVNQKSKPSTANTLSYRDSANASIPIVNSNYNNQNAKFSLKATNSNTRRSSLRNVATNRKASVSKASYAHTAHQNVSKSITRLANSNTTKHNGNQQLCKGLTVKDLKIFDFSLYPKSELLIHVRKNIVILVIDPLRALITCSRIFFFIPPKNGDVILSVLREYISDLMVDARDSDEVLASSLNINDVSGSLSSPLTTNNPKREVPFELQAYEGMLSTVEYLLNWELQGLEIEAHGLLKHFKNQSLISFEVQDAMREIKNKTRILYSRALQYRKYLEDFSHFDDDTLALMNLTLLRHQPQLYSYPLSKVILSKREFVEDILDRFAADFGSLENKLNHLLAQIQSAEDLVSLRLDIVQNQTLVATTLLAIFMSAVQVANLIASTFGMNLDQNKAKGSFVTVFIFSGVVITIVYSVAYIYLARLGVVYSRSQLSADKKYSIRWS